MRPFAGTDDIKPTDKVWIVSTLLEYTHGVNTDYQGNPIKKLQYKDFIVARNCTIFDALEYFNNASEFWSGDTVQNRPYKGKIIGIKKCELTDEMIETIKKFA